MPHFLVKTCKNLEKIWKICNSHEHLTSKLIVKTYIYYPRYIISVPTGSTEKWRDNDFLTIGWNFDIHACFPDPNMFSLDSCCAWSPQDIVIVLLVQWCRIYLCLGNYISVCSSEVHLLSWYNQNEKSSKNEVSAKKLRIVTNI